MDITPEQRSEKFQNSSSEIQILYSSSESGVFLRKIFNKYNLDESLYKIYAITSGNVVLGFHSISDLPQKFSENLSIDDTKAESITADLIDFLSPVLKEQESGTETQKTTFSPTPQAMQQPVATPEVSQQPPTEIPPSTVEPLRTMEHDMDRIHGYGSYRKLYPDTETPQVTENTPAQTAAVPDNLPEAGAPVGYAQAEIEKTVQSLSQEDMLNRPLADTPKYTDPNSK